MRIFTMKYRGLRILAIFTIVWVMWTVALAADDSTAARKGKLEVLLAKNISVQFRNTPIEDVLRIMADQADVDIVKSPKVKGDVTVTLTDVPLEEALNNILSVHGFNYVLSENMIRVITSEEVAEKPEVLQTKTFEIVYADVTEVVKALEKFKSAKGSVSFIQGTSHVIVTDTETKIREIALFIEKIDVMTKQVLVEVRIYDVTSEETFDLGVNWHVGRNTPITEVSETDTSTRSTGRKITDVGETMEVTTETTTQTDTYEPGDTEPTTEIKTVYTTTGGTTPGTIGDTTTTTGSDSDTITKTIDGTWISDTYRKSKPFMGVDFDQEKGGTLSFGLLNDAVDIELALNILHKQVGAKLLANPRILVLDNETAKINIVSEIPYQQLQQGGGTTQSFGTTAFKDVGVTLEVTPHIAERDEMVRLKLKPSFSIQTGTVNVGDPAQNTYPQPVVDKREAETVLLIKSGVTVVLAGLRKSEVTQDIRKVPLLGDLPLIKELFRSESESTTTSEIIVFITPHIIEEPVMTSDEQQTYKSTEFKGPKPAITKAEKDAEK